MTAPSTALSTYMRGLASAEVMSAEEEKAAAERLGRLRADRWAIILSYPPIAFGILELVERRLGEDLDANVLQAASQATSVLRQQRRVTHERAYKAAMKALATELAELDRDQIVADMVCSDLESIENGDFEHLNMQAAVPRRTDTFSRYVRRVRRANTAFWAARNEFVRKNLRLVVSMARRFGRGRMPTEDLVQEGNLGLMKAVDRFDPSKGFRFSTYGAWWIRHAINRAVQNKARDVRLPVHVLDAIQKLAEARRRIEMETGEPADREALSERTGIPIEKIMRLERSIVFDQPTAIDEGDDEHRGSRSRTLTDDTRLAPSEELEQRRVARGIDEAIADLPEMERDILRRRFGLDGGDPMTLREIGEHYQLSRERIRQIQERAISRIRDELAAAELL